MNRGLKRPPDYVPVQFRRELMDLSKADLAELVWDFAMRCTGRCDDPEAYDEAMGSIQCATNALRIALGRSPIKGM